MDEYSKSGSTLMSDDIRAITAALIVAKQAIEPIRKTKKGNYGYYASLEDIYATVDNALAKNGINIVHGADYVNGVELLHTRVVHATSGQWIQDTRVLASEKPGNQGRGSATTYMRRYAVMSLLAISDGELDDDGEDEVRYIERKATEPSISADQLKILQDEIRSRANAVVLLSNILGFNKIKDLSELKVSSFNSVRTYIANHKG